MQDVSFFTAGDGARIAYRYEGRADLPTLVLANSIGTSLHMWDAQIPALTRHFRVLRYDYRGHGASSVPQGPYSLDRLGRDVLELLDGLSIARAHFLGLSLGGIVGQWLGVHAPERIDRLILSNTSAYLGPAPQWDERIAATLRAQDMSETAQTFLKNWFPSSWIEAGHPALEPFRAVLLGIDKHGLAGAFAAVRDADLRRTVALIPNPTLVIAGQHDTVTAASHGEQIAATIPGAKLLTLPAVHMPNIEVPEAFETAVVEFLLAA
ncbi:3-oxoadipate enol-lactonase 2 [Achromobacter insolitus]|uniref:3-oxoadipate enol-lactonase n=1 Tax=Achromobacter insolitus TaxID=217204 RepID=UPI0009726AD6|nr:3-oxoadipate enol-lactonase [Achromobacter insolitus]APX78212.1 3-oxoadipate enol-lactonase [Achromobacter insolitus]OWT62693.1 3-oxoadipate enol-lactonase [Achromobacter insolitus]CAB3657738.1 3-oxoadipate enol-lactonase 2 [Achromobacter insolitus]VEG65819.1 3-oxoadipate enol-lactonase 2 [Achromobacter insolitus]